MRLEDKLYVAVREEMPGHGIWHLARLPEHEYEGDRRQWKDARQRFPHLAIIGQPGAGRQFLEFHRDMMRHFDCILDCNPGHSFDPTPWRTLPSWIRPLIDPQHWRDARQWIEHFVHHATLDDLGTYIETAAHARFPGAGIHNLLHGAIDDHELRTCPPADIDDAWMGRMDTSHHNAHFWHLHRWIDDIYFRWQVVHGELPDRSPAHGEHAMSPSEVFVLNQGAIANLRASLR